MSTDEPQPSTLERAGAPPSRTTLVVVFATILIDFIGFSVLIPVLPLFAKRLGADALQVGLILALYALAQLLFLPMWGWISDRVGRRPVLLISLLGTAASFVLLTMAESIEWIYAARVAAGFFAASIGTAQAVVTDVTEPAERASGMGMIGAAFGAGMIVGPAMGGALASFHEHAPFYGVAILAAASFAFAWFALPETKPPDLELRWNELGRSLIPTPILLFTQVHDRRIAIFLGLFFVLFSSFAVLEAMATWFMAERFEKDVVDAAIFFAWVGVFLVVTQGLLLRRLVDLAGEVRLVITGLTIMAIGIATIAVVSSYTAFFVLGAVIAVGQGIAFPTFASLYTKVCRSEEAGELLGHSNSMATAGRVVAGVGGGWLMGQSPGAPFLASGALMLFGLAVFLAFRSYLLRGID